MYLFTIPSDTPTPSRNLFAVSMYVNIDVIR